MKSFITLAIIIITTAVVGTAQNRANSRGEMREAAAAARKDARDTKKQELTAALTTSDFNDPDSFGGNVKFLGALYAGTVYYYHSCDPATLENEVGVVLAADDHCYVIALGPNPSETTDDPVWQVTIPGKTVDNVIYPMLNNSTLYENDGSTAGGASVFYSPRITLVSEAFNDPAAIVNGVALNGSYTTTLSGGQSKALTLAGGEFDSQSYGSVSGRGFSRNYFKSIGLPNSVINKFFKKPVTLKFGLRTNVGGAITFAQFFYTFRLLGN